jgi:ATP-binding cassette subfamily B protein
MTGSSRPVTDLALFRRLFSETRSHRLQIACIFVISMLAAPLALLTPVPLAIAVDSAIGSQPLPGFLDGLLPAAVSDSSDGVLIFAALMFAAIAILTAAQELGNTVLKTYTGEKLLLTFRNKLFQQSQRLSLAYHDRVGTSDSTYRVQEDAKSLQYIAVESLISIVTAATTLVAMIYVTARIDFELALVAIAVTPVLTLAALHFRPRMRATSREVKKLESGALSVVQEVLTGLRVVKAFGQEDREQERFFGQSSLGMRARIRLAVLEGGYALLVGGIIGAGGGVVLFVGVHHVQSGIITLGELLLIMGYLTQLYAPIKTMARKAGSLQNYLASAERAFALLEEAPDVPERPHARPVARASGAVEFRDVSFAYGSDRLALDNVSFAVAPGTRVGVAGVTGAGKTTLMNLLTRFYDPAAGQILLEGVDLRDYKLADLRSQFGIVLQDTVLFSTSIAENIAYARPDAGRRELEEAAAAANIHDFIMRLPEGYDTQVGERGMRLSGGERQRISLARAFLKDARILILDEPTSSVDVETEALILDAMERLMEGRTSFMIAHRLSTLEICDLKLELDQGRVVKRTRLPRASRVARVPRPAAPDEVLEHPAVRAWLSLGGAEPQQVSVLKAKRFRKRGVYRLDGAGPGGAPVIAKICNRRTGEVESAVYEHLLPRLPMPHLRFYGNVPDGDRQHCWLFLEDAGAERYSPAEAEHRRLAARWLANVQLHAGEFVRDSDLPSRGSSHYLIHLFNARDEITRQMRREEDGSDGTLVLEDLLTKLDLLESRWEEIAAFCDTLPQTVVHGDFVPKNLRIMRNRLGIGLAIFDWETAGLGTQAPDLAQLLEPELSALARKEQPKRLDRFSANPCLDTYRSVLAASSIGPDVETVEQLAAVGNVLRCLAGLDWTCSQMTAEWCPIEDFRVYSEWLGDALQVAGWGPSGGKLLKLA